MKTTFLLNANASVGYGHMGRCSNVAHHLKSLAPQWPIIFAGDYDEFARNRIASAGHSTQSEQEFLAGTSSHVLVVDSYQLTPSRIDELCERAPITVFVDDFGKFGFEHASFVVNFTALAEKRYNYRARKSLLGLSYYPAEAGLITLREERRPISQLKKVLVFFSGKRGTEAIQSRILHELNEITTGVQFRLLLPAGLTVELPQSGRNEFSVQPTDQSIAAHLRWCDGLLSGGGLVKYESAFAHVYNGSIASTAGQRQDSEILQELGLSHHLGFMSDLDDPAALMNIRRQLDSFFHDSTLRSVQYERQSTHFDSASGPRLAREILHV